MVAYGGIDAHGRRWHLAPCLVALVQDIDTLAPGRSTRSDGSIGDTAHQARPSDHNPDATGTVAAVDITNDPTNGVDAWKIAQTIAAQIAAGHERRIKYLISGDPSRSGDLIFHVHNGRWQWDPHPHTNGTHNGHHLHVSAVDDPFLRSSIGHWTLTIPQPSPPIPQDEHTMYLIQRGTGGPIAATDFVAKRALGPAQVAAARNVYRAQHGLDLITTVIDAAVYDAIPG